MNKQKTLIIRRDQHIVSRKHIDPDALSVLRHLNRNGHKAYLVGGGVRDILLGQKPKDFDISTDAEPARIRRLFRNCFLIGRRFRLAHIRFGRSKVIETSTFRKAPPPTSPGTDSGELLQWDDNVFGTPEEDAKRRDFTVNALFYDLNDFSLIDHVGGIHDLKKGLIRSIGDPNIRFREDPVRMIRAVRFAARLHFQLESSTRKAIIKHHAEISHASPARLQEEIYKLFSYHSAEAAFFLLWKLKMMSVLFPEVHQYVEKSGGDNAPLWRYLAALDSGEHWPDAPSSALMLATLLCDPLMQKLANDPPVDIPVLESERVDDFLNPVMLRFKIPKALKFRIGRMLADQLRMDQAPRIKEGPDGRRRGFPVKRILSQEVFPEALALLEIRAAAGEAAPETLGYWTNASKEDARATPPPPDSSSPAPARRRRRRRRRKTDHATPNL